MSRPNIIFILSDQHSGKVAGFSGDKYVRTPNLDALAKRGAVLGNVYCNSPLCVPSRMSMLSGRYPSDVDVTNNMECLRSDRPTFVTELTNGGYETVLCGRMHFVGYDQRHGYEKRLGTDIMPTFFSAGGRPEIYGECNFAQGQGKKSVECSGVGENAVLKYDDGIFAEATRYIRSRTDERPLFLTVGLYGPHCPYIAPKELFDYYYKVLPEIDFDEENEHPAIAFWKENRKISTLDKADVRRVRAAYYAMVEYLDAKIGELLEEIYKKFDQDQLIVVYSSDHGDMAGEHGMFWKSNFYEASAHVPAIFSGKNIVRGHIGDYCSLIDYAPTFLEFAECEKLDYFRGESLVKVLSGKGEKEDKLVFSELCDIKGDNPSAMVIKGGIKLVCHAGYDEPYQLFDLNEDKAERRNLFADKAYADVFGELKKELYARWSPERELERLAENKRTVAAMKKWTATVKPQPIEQFASERPITFLEEAQDET